HFKKDCPQREDDGGSSAQIVEYFETLELKEGGVVHLSNNKRGLAELARQGLLGQEKLSKLEFYDNCTLGKQHKVKFRVRVHNSNRPFEYVHSDLWGRTSVSTHG
ncbi:hypothetical protein A2U01_0042522, partial [Trifolium medium]|nr:hypothetical protein [Trifolium medium]